MLLTRPAWIEVNLDKLKYNFRTIKDHLSENTEIISVVKANAYGYGAVQVVEIALEENINNFAVATLNEAISLRRHFSDIEILVLGFTPSYLIESSILNGITMTVYNMECAREIEECAHRLGVNAKINISVDSGMNRIGFKVTRENADIIKEISMFKHIDITGMFTHFAAADTDSLYTKYQFQNYMNMVRLLDERNVNIPLKHVNNSQGIINYREYDLDAVRPGILQYGSTEGVLSKYLNFDVNYIGELKAQIANLKTVGAGEKVSYGLTYETEEETKIATLPIGYADGVLRQLSGKIDVLISGKRCRQIGRICMDQMMVDATGVDCKIGDEAVIIGSQGDECISILEIAHKASEIATSYSCHFSDRLPRVYIKDGKKSFIVDKIIER